MPDTHLNGGLAGLSSPLLFTFNKIRLSRDKAHYSWILDYDVHVRLYACFLIVINCDVYARLSIIGNKLLFYSILFYSILYLPQIHHRTEHYRRSSLVC